MKILFLLTQDLESPSGVGRFLPWAQGLARLGHQVTIAALHSNYDSLKETHQVKAGVDVDYVAQMHVMKRDNLKSYYPAHQLLGVAWSATRQLIRAAWNSPADIIQVCKPHPMNGTAGLVARYLKGKIVFLDCDDFEAANISTQSNWKKVGVRYFENMLPKHVDYVTVHNSYLRNMIESLGVRPERIIYLPNGVDEQRFSQVDQTQVEKVRQELGLVGKKVIIFIGSLSLPSHPVDILLDVFQQVYTVLPESRLLIVGGGEEYDHLVARVNWLGLKEAVIFRGRVPGVEVPIHLRLADVSIDPVMDDPVGRSRLPLKMFESWACGVPFITQDVGDRRLVMGEPPAGLLTEPGDPGLLASAILRLLGDPELSNQLRERGYQQAKQYSWDSLSRQMEATYEKALSRKNGGPD